MSALPAPTPGPANNRDLITNFRSEYGAALADAHESASMTQTDGWRRLYTDFRESDRKARRDLSARLRKFSDRLEDVGMDEDDEKGVKEVAKLSGELRDASDFFDRDTVGRVRAPVESCSTLIENYLCEAARQENAAPLHNVGLVEMMRFEISKHGRPTWSDDTGTVKIALSE